MGAAIRFHHIGARAMAEHDGDEPCKNDAYVRPLGRILFTAPYMMASFRSTVFFQLPFFYPFLIGEVEIEEHHHARLRIEAGKGDDADPHGDAHVIIEKIKKPERPDEGKGNGKKDDRRLRD